MRPGVDVVSRDQPVAHAVPTDTSVCFAVGTTEKGPASKYTLVTSLGQYEAVYGARSGGATLYDAIDAYFREGGGQVYVSALPTTPSMMLQAVVDTGDTEAAAAQARTQAQNGSRYSESELNALTREELDGIAASAGLDPADYPTKSDEVNAILGGGQSEAGLLAVLDPTTLASALDVFGAELGPGQVIVPGASTSAMHAVILAHCEQRNRVGLLDGPQVPTVAGLQALATAQAGTPQARYGALLAPYGVVPGIAGGTVRQVPWSAIQAGMIARSDAALNPNVAVAGDNGISGYATDVSAVFKGSEYDTLNASGVDMARFIYGDLKMYGYRSLVSPTGTDSEWLMFSNSRLYMAIAAQAKAIGERYVFDQMDGRWLTISAFGAALSAMLLPFWERGALYGSTPDEAFGVNVGPQVNTPATIAAGELHAVLSVKMSPFSEYVKIEIVKVETTTTLLAA